MLFELSFICLSNVLLYLHDLEFLALPDLPNRIIKLAVFLVTINFFWHFRIYMKTDIYYVITNLFRCRNFTGDAFAYVMNLVSRVFKGVKAVALEEIPKMELRASKVYTLILIPAIIITLVPFFLFVFPILSKLIYEALVVFWKGYDPTGRWDYIDAVMVLFINFSYFFLLGYAIYIKHIRHKGRLRFA